MIHIGGITIVVLLSAFSLSEGQGMWLIDVCTGLLFVNIPCTHSTQ